MQLDPDLIVQIPFDIHELNALYPRIIPCSHLNGFSYYMFFHHQPRARDPSSPKPCEPPVISTCFPARDLLLDWGGSNKIGSLLISDFLPTKIFKTV